MKALGCGLLFVSAVWGQSLAGTWDATVVSGGVPVPFRMEFATQGTQVQAWFFNADARTPSTFGRLENGSLLLRFDHLGTRLEAKWNDGHLEGTYYGDKKTGTLAFRAQPASAQPETQGSAPSIAGEWEIAHVKSGKGEAAWRFLVQQSGADVTATVLRVDGDMGALSGRYRNGKFVLSHFSGARSALLLIEPQADGSLHLKLNRDTEYRAVRPKEARAEGLPAPTDPDLHTSMKDPAEPFRFSFRDLNGRAISESDPRFRDKVVIVSILGSWCPNCHDEAPFLAELDRSYRDRGLAIVGLAFEEADQLADPVRLRAFVEQYGIGYPMLVCGEPDQASEKMPQLRNFDAWPTILLLGRDGRVRKVHAGFPSGGSGAVYTQTKQQITADVESLLAEDTVSAR